MASQLKVDEINPQNPVIPVEIKGPTPPTYLGVPLMTQYPRTPAGANQAATRLFAGNGIPNNADGSNGDFYFRGDGGSGTSIYHKRSGAWVGIV